MPFNIDSFASGAKSIVNSASQTVGSLADSVNTLKTDAAGALAGIEAKLAGLGATGSLKQLGSLIRGKNVLSALGAGSKSSVTAAEFRTPGGKDWRVRLSFPIDVDYLTSNLLQPLLETGGLVFPYTPTITIAHTASYQAMDPVHNNYPFFAYQNSKVDSMTITGEFYCEDSVEARYWVAVVHYLRSVTKMSYGDTTNAGAPPPVVRLNGYGDYVFNNVPVIITSFNVELSNDVDYISTGLGGSPATGSTGTAAEGTTWAPVKSQITVTVQPIYSREQVRNFSLGKFVKGDYIKDGDGFI